MKKELEDKICKEFPEFFTNAGDLKQSLMGFGFETGNGWFDLIYNLCKDIKEELDKTGGKMEILQVKEKYGGLRFYIGSASHKIFDMIHKAEEDSYNICEVCGKKGELRTDLSWIQTLCNVHYRKVKHGK